MKLNTLMYLKRKFIYEINGNELNPSTNILRNLHIPELPLLIFVREGSVNMSVILVLLKIGYHIMFYISMKVNSANLNIRMIRFISCQFNQLKFFENTEYRDYIFT